MEWIIIALLTFFAIRWLNMLILMSMQNEENQKPVGSCADEQKFKEILEDKNEEDLWKLRNELHDKMVKAKDGQLQKNYLNCIGLIDKKIYELRH